MQIGEQATEQKRLDHALDEAQAELKRLQPTGNSGPKHIRAFHDAEHRLQDAAERCDRHRTKSEQ